MEKIILLNSGKTKSGSTVLTYAYKDPSERFKKGLAVRTQFIDISDLHDKLPEENFPIKCEAEFGYQDTYEGQARKVIVKLQDLTGKIIFAL